MSRRLRDSFDNENETIEKNIDDFIDDQLNCVRVCFVRALKESKFVLNDDYSKKSISIAIYLTSMQKFLDMNQKQFRKFKLNIFHFMIRDKQLFRRVNKNMSFRQIIDSDENKNNIVESLHDKSEHRDKKDIYRKMIDRY